MRRLSDEEHRHRCEVRFVLAWAVRDRLGARAYLASVRKVSARADRLEWDCEAQWMLGNRGERGDWR